MLGPKFKEGHALAAASSIQLSLPDDDPAAMVTVCQILHHRHDDVPDRLTCEQILTIASLADKYNCVAALKPNAQGWITENLNLSTATTETRRSLLVAAYNFRHASLFQQISRDLILNSRHQPWKPGMNVDESITEVIEKVLSTCPHPPEVPCRELTFVKSFLNTRDWK